MDEVIVNEETLKELGEAIDAMGAVLREHREGLETSIEEEKRSIESVKLLEDALNTIKEKLTDG